MIPRKKYFQFDSDCPGLIKIMQRFVYSIFIYDLDESYHLNFPLSVIIIEEDINYPRMSYMARNDELDIFSDWFLHLHDAINYVIENIISLYQKYIENDFEYNNALYICKYKRILTKLITKVENNGMHISR